MLYVRSLLPVLLLAMLPVRVWGQSPKTPRTPGMRTQVFADERFGNALTHRLAPAPQVESKDYLAYTSGLDEHLAVRWSGRLRVPASGAYRFYYRVDDRLEVYIDDELVLQCPRHTKRWREQTVELQEGWRDLRVDFVQEGGGAR